MTLSQVGDLIGSASLGSCLKKSSPHSPMPPSNRGHQKLLWDQCKKKNSTRQTNPKQIYVRINPKSKRDKWSIRGKCKCYGIAYALGMSCEPSNIFFCSSIPVGSIMWMDAWRHRILVQSSPFHSEHIRSQNSPPFRKGWCRKQKTQILQWWSSSLLAF